MARWSRRDFVKAVGSSLLCAPSLRFCLPLSAEAQTNPKRLLFVFLEGGCDTLFLRPALGGAFGSFLQEVRPNLLANQTFLPAREDGYGWHSKATALSAFDLQGSLAIVDCLGGPYPSGSHERAQLLMAEGFDPEPAPGQSTPTLKAKGILGLMADKRGLSSLERIGIGTLTDMFLRNAQQPGLVTSGLGGGGFHWSYYGLDREHAARVTNDVVRRLATERAGDRYVRTLADSYGAIDDLRERLTPFESFVNALDPKPRTSSPHGWETSFRDALFAMDPTNGLNSPLVAINVDNWDSHGGQLTSYPRMIESLSAGLDLFYKNAVRLGFMKDVIIVCMTEFNRRVKQNANSSATGTDHGGPSSTAFVISDPANIRAGTIGSVPEVDRLKNEFNYILPRSVDAHRFFATIATQFGVKPSDIYPNRSLDLLPIFT